MPLTSWATDDELTSARLNEMVTAVNDFQAFIDGTYSSLLTLAGGLTVTRNADAYALTAQNTHANGKALAVLTPAGAQMVTVDVNGLAVMTGKRVAVGNNVSISGGGTWEFATASTSSTAVASKQLHTVELDLLGGTSAGHGDSGAGRYETRIGRPGTIPTSTFGYQGFRALEVHSKRFWWHDTASVGTEDNTWIMELGLDVDYRYTRSDTNDYFAGLFLYAPGNGLGVPHRQRISTNISPTGGTFTITYSGQTTATINYNDVAAVVDSRLEALSVVGSGNVTVSGGPLSAGTPFDITFNGALSGTGVETLTVNSSLTAGSAVTVTVTDITGGRNNAAVRVSGDNAGWGQALRWYDTDGLTTVAMIGSLHNDPLSGGGPGQGDVMARRHIYTTETRNAASRTDVFGTHMSGFFDATLLPTPSSGSRHLGSVWYDPTNSRLLIDARSKDSGATVTHRDIVLGQSNTGAGSNVIIGTNSSPSGRLHVVSRDNGANTVIGLFAGNNGAKQVVIKQAALAVTGTDSNIDLDFQTQGTGAVLVNGVSLWRAPVQAAASGALALTTSAQDITGCSVSLDRVGRWKVTGHFLAHWQGAADNGAFIYGTLACTGGTSSQTTGTAICGPETDTNYRHVAMTWHVNVTAATVTAKLQARKNAGAGTSTVDATDTVITAEWLGKP